GRDACAPRGSEGDACRMAGGGGARAALRQRTDSARPRTTRRGTGLLRRRARRPRARRRGAPHGNRDAPRTPRRVGGCGARLGAAELHPSPDGSRGASVKRLLLILLGAVITIALAVYAG